ncbi:MAG: hypothetical protein R6V19_17445 [Armatimonadota bacterium]
MKPCKHMMLRATGIIFLLMMAGSASAVEEGQFRPQVEAFMADEAVVEVEVGERLRTEDVREWPDPGVVRVKLNPMARRDGEPVHSAILDEQTGAVRGFIAGEPNGPVPMDVMPEDDAVAIAKQFAQRHLPELFADGGEVDVTVGDEISSRGGREVHLQRTVKGVQVPTVGDLEVRVYDGKIVYWRKRHVPFDDGLRLPGEVTLEDAHDIAAENVPHEQFEPVFWFDETHKVVVTEDGQHNVWDLVAEIKRPTTPDDRLGRFGHWQIDANSGDVVLSEALDPNDHRDLISPHVRLPAWILTHRCADSPCEVENAPCRHRRGAVFHSSIVDSS